MAAPKKSQSTIDNLPEAQRRQVLDALLAGESLRKVAVMAGCTHQAVHDYKRRIVQPAIKTAQKLQSFESLSRLDAVRAVEQTALTRDIIRSSPFKERLEKLWDRTDRSLEKAENAVREIKDNQGNIVAIAQDLSAIAPLLNQAHKNVELLGRVTGELEQVAAPTVAIQIVMPSMQGPSGQAEVEPPTIDIGLPKR